MALRTGVRGETDAPLREEVAWGCRILAYFERWSRPPFARHASTNYDGHNSMRSVAAARAAPPHELSQGLSP
jgi:hypothetical protein